MAAEVADRVGVRVGDGSEVAGSVGRPLQVAGTGVGCVACCGVQVLCCVLTVWSCACACVRACVHMPRIMSLVHNRKAGGHLPLERFLRCRLARALETTHNDAEEQHACLGAIGGLLAA